MAHKPPLHPSASTTFSSYETLLVLSLRHSGPEFRNYSDRHYSEFSDCLKEAADEFFKSLEKLKARPDLLQHLTKPEFFVRDFVVYPSSNRHFVCLECSSFKKEFFWLGLFENRKMTTTSGIEVSRSPAWATAIEKGELLWTPILDNYKTHPARYYTTTGIKFDVSEDSDDSRIIEMPIPKEPPALKKPKDQGRSL